MTAIMAEITVDDAVTDVLVRGAHRTKPTNMMSKIMLGQARPRTHILPVAVRWISETGLTILVERPPSYTSVVYTDTRAASVSSGTPQTYTIPTPWLEYIVSFRTAALEAPQLSVCARNEPLRSVDDLLGYFPLPNMGAPPARPGEEHPTLYWQPNLICQGPGFTAAFEAHRAAAGGTFDLPGAALAAINVFWDSNFNRDIFYTVKEFGYCFPQPFLDDLGPAVTTVGPGAWLEYLEKLSLPDVLGLEWATLIKFKDLVKVFDPTQTSLSFQMATLMERVVV